MPSTSLQVPFGYQRALVSLGWLQDWLLVHHHPEYVRRLVAWLESQGGDIGVGGGWRYVQPDKSGFAPEGKSFHQDQSYADGFVGACAVDLVHRNGTNIHRAPYWSEVPAQGSKDAQVWGVHCNVSAEPWHMQPVEIDGWQSWVYAGRPAPKPNYPIPGTQEAEQMINWKLPDSVLATVKSAPPTADTLAGKYDDWAMIAAIKFCQAITGQAVTGRWDQGFGERLNDELAKRGIKL